MREWKEVQALLRRRGASCITLRLVEPPPEPLRVAAGFHALDEELVKRLLAFAKTLDGFALLVDFPIDLEHQPEAISGR